VTIERIEIFAPIHRLARERVYSTGGGFVRGSVLVRITDRDGVAGWGETYPHAGVVATIDDLAREMIGLDPMRANELQDLMRRLTGDGFAISALSIAIDDLRARRIGVPIATLYGGAIRSSARAYASSGGYVSGLAPIDAWREEAARVKAAGITGIKLRIGREPSAVEIPMLEQLAAETTGLDLMADGNAAYTPARALDMGRALGAAGYRWFEEPIPTDDYAGYEWLRARLPLTLAGGESVQSRGAARALLERAAVDIIQPDPTICGGIGDALFIGALARLHAIQMHPHACNGAVALAATLQLIAVLPGATRMGGDAPLDEPLLEYDFGENPLRTELLATPLEPHGGRFTIPTGPGLGVVVDDDRLEGGLVRTER
jgi:D-galactarolactone cycloisomerase